MIWTVVRVGLLRMWHGRTEILLTFAVPIAFFTVFAFIFDEQVGLGKSPRVNVVLVDEDGTELSGEFLSALAERPTLREISDALEESFHAKGGMKYLYQIMPGGPVAQGCKLAGLQVPAGAVDKSFGSVQ